MQKLLATSSAEATHCDIYSLGVLLSELLTGSTPPDRKRVREAAAQAQHATERVGRGAGVDLRPA
jgi:serine/threonine protein kinase